MPAITVDSFQCQPNKTKSYENLVEKGTLKLKESRIVIAGLGRNIANHIEPAVAAFSAFGSLCKDYNIFLYENDSTDDTVPNLYKLKRLYKNFCFRSVTREDPVNRSVRCTKRTTRMALYREEVQRYVRNNYADWDYVILYDFDLGNKFSKKGLITTFGHKFKWDAMFGNSIFYKKGWSYYDVWALRWQNSYAPLWSRDVNPMKWWIGDDPIAVYSAFGGLGVYRMIPYLHGRYDGSDCEHVPFHKHMRDNGFGELYLNPNQVTLYS